jgi:hypothetical protein
MSVNFPSERHCAEIPSFRLPFLFFLLQIFLVHLTLNLQSLSPFNPEGSSQWRRMSVNFPSERHCAEIPGRRVGETERVLKERIGIYNSHLSREKSIAF